MYIVTIRNNEGTLIEKLFFRFRDEAEDVMEAFFNLTDYDVEMEEQA